MAVASIYEDRTMRKLCTITKVSPFTGKYNTRTIKMDIRDYRAWKCGSPIQNILPYLTDDDREFLMTGITKEEWDAEFGNDV
jgi:hypothetical protein